MPDAFAERVLQHQLAFYQQIGSVQMLVGALLAFCCYVVQFLGFLITIA